jgi:phytanoyl-CoA hydroxylase
MRSSFTPHEIAGYRRDGFLAVPDFLTETKLAYWRAVVDAAAADQRAQAGTLKEHVFTQRMQLRRTSPDVQQLVQDPRIGGLAAELEGVDALRIFLDQALVKEPYGTPTQYHQDLPWFSFDSPHACTIWVALDDATLENGCLYFVPGSHLLGLTAPVDLGPDLGAVFHAQPEAASMPVPCPLPAGGCSFHNARTVHGAGANMTPGRRRAMSVAFMPDGVRFNGIVDGRVLPEEYADTLAEGDRLENDELNPVVYSSVTSARR